MLVILAGPPCSGKSTTGARLAQNLPGIHLEVDALLTLIRPDSDRCLEDRLLAYELAAAGARTILSRGVNLILDCTYSRGQVRQQLLHNLKPDDRLIVVEFAVSPDVAVRRFTQRGPHAATDLTPEMIRIQAESYPYGYGTVVVNSESNAEDIKASVIQAIRSGDCDFNAERWARFGL